MQPLVLANFRLIVLHRIFTLSRLQIIQQQLGRLSPLAEEDTNDDVLYWFLLWGARYTGQEYDPETGFYYYNARYYDPQLGVFTTADTEFDKDQGSFAFNRHMYVRGNPIMYSDPTGHFFFAALIQLAGLIAGAGAATRGAITGDWSAKNLAMGAGQGLAIAGSIAVGVATGGAAFAAYSGTAGVLGASVTAGVVGGAAGGFVGGSTNTWLNGGSFGEGLAYGVVGGVFGAMAGAAGGFAGYGMGAIAGNGFWGSVATGAAAGFGGGFVGGALGGLGRGRSFGDSMLDGLTAGGWGAVAGGVIGGLGYGISGRTTTRQSNLRNVGWLEEKCGSCYDQELENYTGYDAYKKSEWSGVAPEKVLTGNTARGKFDGFAIPGARHGMIFRVQDGISVRIYPNMRVQYYLAHTGLELSASVAEHGCPTCGWQNADAFVRGTVTGQPEPGWEALRQISHMYSR